MQTDQALIDAAFQAQKRAYVPYSRFPVGAAVRTARGAIYSGCNVENISLRLTLCAEEVAIGAAVVAGERDLVAVAVVADSREPILPCGGCRQLLAEFNPAIEVISAIPGGRTEHYRLDELLPRPKQGILEQQHE